MNLFQRDTKDWYLTQDPIKVVSNGIIAFVRKKTGNKILDFGCGPGGYSARLTQLGFDCTGADINEKYLKIAQGLRVKTSLVKDNKLDFPDDHFDTALLIEVLEHLEDPASVLKEIKRVVKKNVLITVPNSTRARELSAANVVFEHFLDIDHKNYFTASSLKELLAKEFREVKIWEKEAIDADLTLTLLPKIIALPVALFFLTHLLKAKFFFHLYAEARK